MEVVEYVFGNRSVKKLTLSMEEKDIRAARRLARRHGTSISGMFTRMVRVLAGRPRGEEELPPITRKLAGMVELPKHKSDRELVEDALLEKHGLDR